MLRPPVSHPIPLLFALLMLHCATSGAQSLPGSGNSPGPADGGRAQSTNIGFFELLESGGEAFLDLFRENKGGRSVDNPKWDSLESPRQTVMTFLEAMSLVVQGRDEAWSRARACLGPAEDGETVRDHAEALLNVFDRLPRVAPSSLPGAELVARQEITRYEFFPRGIDASFAYQALPEAPAGSIQLLRDGDRWVFSGPTVRGAPELLESMRRLPPRPRLERRGELFLDTVGPTFSATAPGGWLKFLAWSAAGIAAAWIAGFLLHRGETRLRRLGDFILAPLLTGLRLPVIIVLATVGAMIGSASLHLEPAISRFRWTIFQALFILAIIWLLVSLIELAVVSIQRSVAGDDNPYARMLSTVIRRCVRIAAVILLVVFFIQNVLEWNITALLGGIGILALAISLAAKDAVANLFGSITVFANRPFVSGDWVRFEGEIGVIEDVSIQVTRIRLLSGELWSVPNMRFVDRPVENLSSRRYLRRVLHLSLPYGTPPDRIERGIEVLDEILRSDKVCSDGRSDPEKYPPQIQFTEFGAYSLNLRVDYYYLMDSNASLPQRETDRGYLSFLQHCSEVNLLIARRFAEEDLEFAFPTQTIELQEAKAA